MSADPGLLGEHPLTSEFQPDATIALFRSALMMFVDDLGEVWAGGGVMGEWEKEAGEASISG